MPATVTPILNRLITPRLEDAMATLLDLLERHARSGIASPDARAELRQWVAAGAVRITPPPLTTERLQIGRHREGIVEQVRNAGARVVLRLREAAEDTHLALTRADAESILAHLGL